MHTWLFKKYWLVAGLIVGLTAPLVAVAGGPADYLAIGVFGALSVAGWLASKRYEGFAVRAHLTVIVPYWGWYAALPGGFPARFEATPAGLSVLIVFPVLVGVALDGIRGALRMGVIAGATVCVRYGFTVESLTGLFIVGVAILIGFSFWRQTRQLTESHDRLLLLATRDPLTELPNRRLLAERLAKAEDGTLLVVSLRRFKTVNEAYSHATGDVLLRKVGERIQEEVDAFIGASAHAAPTLVAYHGGDSFAVLLASTDATRIEAVAHRLLTALSKPFRVFDADIQIGGRIGVVTWPTDGVDRARLLGCGERVAARARRSPEHLAFFDPVLDRELDTGLEVELWRALKQRELEPFFQPVCDLQSGEMIGVEALVRWRHPTRGLVPPYAFVDAAELTGQVVQIDQYMLRATAKQLTKWQEQGLSVWAAVNISARTLDDPSLIGFMCNLLAEFPKLAGSLVLEVTETAAMRDRESACRVLSGLRRLGVQIALDDFGMGHSSLAYLKDFPADHLKLDRHFVNGIGASARDEALLEILLKLASEFRMHVIAEGVETPDQLRWLTARGCGFAQGYLFSPPTVASELGRVRSRVSGVYDVEVRRSSPKLLAGGTS